MLAAASEKILDYSEITRARPRTLIKERLLLNMLAGRRERENLMAQNIFRMGMRAVDEDGVFKIEDEVKQFEYSLFPWTKPVAADGISTPQAKKDMTEWLMKAMGRK
jgi:hypothetical protein